ncbi:MAG: ABC transporter ATP-binding protein [Patescibacteria group bacterium]
MKYIYVIKEYITVAWQCLAYIYKFDKKGTVGRLSILLLFPVIANILNIANAHLADSMQKNFGTGLISAIIPIFLVVVFLEIVDEIFTYLNRRVQWVTNSKLNLILDIERQKKRAQFSLPFIDSEDNDQLNQRILTSGDGYNSQLSLLSSIPQFLTTFINVSFALWIVVMFNPLWALILFATSVPKFFILFTNSFAIRKNSENHLTYNRITNTYRDQITNYTNLKDSKVSNATKPLLDIYVDRREFYRETQYALFKKYLNLNSLAGLFALCFGFFVQYLVIKEVILGTVLIGQATLIVLQIFRLQSGIDALAYFLPAQYENVVSAKYLFLYLSTQENVEKQDAEIIMTTQDTENTIEMKDVIFSYPEIHFEEMRNLVKEIDTVSEKFFGLNKKEEHNKKKSNDFTLTIPSLTIKKGERVAVVGKNGKGKTTFLQLVLNLYQPDQGEIKVFGNVLKDMNQTDVQKYFSMLFQDYGQSNFKVNEYIGLSEVTDPDLERVKIAAQLSTASEFIEKWRDQYTQQLGVSFKGVKPSKGQWQKLALARAIYKDAPILVLDEPTSAIDPVSAKQIFENLAQLDPEKILIYVCHTMVDIPIVATRVIVFEDGNIVGDGTHELLLKTCPQYKELYESERRA